MLDRLKFWRYFVRGSKLDAAFETMRVMAKQMDKDKERLEQQRDRDALLGSALLRKDNRIADLERDLRNRMTECEKVEATVGSRALHYAMELGILTGRLQGTQAELDDLRDAIGGQGSALTGFNIRSGKAFNLAIQNARALHADGVLREKLSEFLFGGTEPDWTGTDPKVYNASVEYRLGAPTRITDLQLAAGRFSKCSRCEERFATEGNHCSWCRWLILTHEHSARQAYLSTQGGEAIPDEELEARDGMPGKG